MRPLWFAAGAGVGAYAVVKARRVAEIFTPEGIQDRMAGVSLGWQLFTDEVRAGMDEKEAELRDRLTLGPDRRPLLESSGRHEHLDEHRETREGMGTPDGHR